MCERLNLIFYLFWKCIWEIRTDNPSLAVKILNGTPRPIVPSQKAWLEIASDNHSRIFTTLLPQIFFSLICLLCIPTSIVQARLFERQRYSYHLEPVSYEYETITWKFWPANKILLILPKLIPYYSYKTCWIKRCVCVLGIINGPFNEISKYINMPQNLSVSWWTTFDLNSHYCKNHKKNVHILIYL